MLSTKEPVHKMPRGYFSDKLKTSLEICRQYGAAATGDFRRRSKNKRDA